MSTLFLSPTYRGNFVSGWDKYVERGSWTHPAPDVYWNPRVGEWRTYAPSAWRFIDENLPRSGPIDFMTNAGTVFDEITQQWSGMTSIRQQSAVWDGREHRWVLAESIGTAGCRNVYEEKLAYLRQLHSSGALDDELFQQQAADLWKRYQHCV